MSATTAAATASAAAMFDLVPVPALREPLAVSGRVRVAKHFDAPTVPAVDALDGLTARISKLALTEREQALGTWLAYAAFADGSEPDARLFLRPNTSALPAVTRSARFAKLWSAMNRDAAHAVNEHHQMLSVVFPLGNVTVVTSPVAVMLLSDHELLQPFMSGTAALRLLMMLGTVAEAVMLAESSADSPPSTTAGDLERIAQSYRAMVDRAFSDRLFALRKQFGLDAHSWSVPQRLDLESKFEAACEAVVLALIHFEECRIMSFLQWGGEGKLLIPDAAGKHAVLGPLATLLSQPMSAAPEHWQERHRARDDARRDMAMARDASYKNNTLFLKRFAPAAAMEFNNGGNDDDRDLTPLLRSLLVHWSLTEADKD